MNKNITIEDVILYLENTSNIGETKNMYHEGKFYKYTLRQGLYLQKELINEEEIDRRISQHEAEIQNLQTMKSSFIQAHNTFQDHSIK